MEAVAERKTSRIDLRMGAEQKRQIEAAAWLSGMSVSQWSISRLVESARRDIAEQEAIRLSEEAFDEFASLLDEPADPAFEEFSRGATRWDA